MESDASSGGERAKGSKRRRRWVLVFAAVASAIALLLLAATLAIYAERRLIAANFVRQYLASYGIESEVEFDRLAWGGFLARVRAGSVDAPDFVADSVDVTLIYPDTSSVVASVTPQVAAVRIVHPVMRVTYDGEKLSFGSLQPLIDEVLSTQSDVPGPEIAIDDGRLLLSTPYGAVTVLADAAIDKNRLVQLNATVERGTLKDGTLVAEITGGTITAAMKGEALNAKASLSLASITHGERTARGVALRADAQGVTWTEDTEGYKFAFASMVVDFAVDSAKAPEFSVGRASARIASQSVEGDWAGEQLRFRGRADISSEAGQLRAAGTEADALKTQASFSAFSFDLSSGQWSADSAARVVLDASGARYPIAGGAVTLTSLHTEFDSSTKLGMEGASGTFKGTLSANGTLPEQIALRALRADFDGEMTKGNSRLLLSALSANTNVPRAQALSLARSIPSVGSDEALALSIATAFQSATVRLRNVNAAVSDSGVALTARAPIVIEGVEKATLTVSPRGTTPLARTAGAQTTGAFNVNVDGGGLPRVRLAVASYRHRVEQNRTMLDADADFETALSYGSFRGIALSGKGKLQMVGDRVRFAGTECADLTLASYVVAGADLVRNLKGRFCGTAIEMSGDRMQVDLATCADVSFEAFRNAGTDQLRDVRGRLCALPSRPLLVSQPSGWQLEANLNSAVTRLVAGEISVSDGTARIQLSGGAESIRSGAITLDRANIADLQTPPRFQPISSSGTMRVNGNDLIADFALSLRERRLASVALKQAIASGTGEAVINARGIAFEPNMLQPADIAPFLSAFGTRIRGNVDFTGRFSWTTDSITSEGRLVVPGVDLQSPFGPVRQLKTELAFTSLMPVALRPAQSVTVDRIDMAVPLEQVSATFSYTPEAVQIDAATASVAQGRATLDPMTYNLAPGATSRGTLRLQNINAQALVEAAGLTDRMTIEARISGTVPFTLGPEGARFIDGRIAATAPGKLSIKREALTASVGTGADGQPPPNAVQDFAYQALEHLAFERLEGVVNSRPMGRLGLLLHVVGQNDPPKVEETRVGILALLRGQAFDKPLPLPKGTPIDLTLDTSFNLDELLDSYLNRSGAGAAALGNAAQ